MLLAAIIGETFAHTLISRSCKIMAASTRNEGASLLSSANRYENVDPENNNTPIASIHPESSPNGQGTAFSTEQGPLHASSVETAAESDEDTTHSEHGDQPGQNDSTAQLSPTTVQAPGLPPKSVQVSTAPAPHPPHGRRGGRRRRRNGPRSLRHNFLDWKFELIAGVLAVAILVCEIILLAHYDGKFLFLHWPHNWKINAVFAFLTTFLEAAIAFYVGACIGQLRWYWFKKKQHRLDWLEIMTEARQPPGAARLLARKGMQRQFAAFGALIILLLLGVSTFTQNVITEEIAPFPLAPKRGYVPIQTNYTWFDKDTTLALGTQQPLPQMVAAIQNGFYSFSTQQRTNGVSAWTGCPGDTCDFGKYQSLAVCSKCEDISYDVVNPCPSGGCKDTDYYTLKNGVDLSLVATNGAVNLTADTKYPTMPKLASAAGPLIVTLNAIVANETWLNKTGTGASAVQCAAWWCVKTYSGKVLNGTLNENLLGEWTDTSNAARTTYRQDENIHLHPPKCFIDDKPTDDPTWCSFKVGKETQVSLQNFLAVRDDSTPFQPFLSGSAVYNGIGANTTWNYTTLVAGGVIAASLAKKQVLANVEFGFNKMAEQMTVNIRGELDSDRYNEVSWGKAYWRQQEFHVRWGWLAYPITLVILSLAFLTGTIIKTRKQEVWKTSILPMIFHAFGGEDHEKFVKLDTIEEMKMASRGQKMSLGEQGGHSQFTAGDVVPEHGRGHEMGQKVAGGFGEFMDAVGRAV